ncbi:MAG: acyl-CoA desaturase [Parachlamydia sp.]|jgi:stearoyl-CoA desaturase (delta-9 desaturase)|nr:acyl-CoA desaturase [Parachlamydia sp.]
MSNKEFNWGPGLFLIIYQIVLALTIPIYFYYAVPSLGMILTSVILLYLTGLSITAGYHRLYSHKAYKVHPAIEAVILFFASMAGQGSALRWSFDHRLHHAHVDTDLDPYSIKKGFWYAHFFWLLDKPRPIEKKIVPDLLRNPLIVFQDRYDVLLMVLTNALAFVFVGWLLDDYLGAFFISLWLRLFALHHFTWFINSLAHTWGDRPFCQEQSAVNNYFISLLTFGEGYHNYHHTFANDYRNGIRWYHFDPTKWLIWSLNKMGLASGLKRMDPFTIRKKMVLERKELLMERLCNIWYVKKDDVEKNVCDISDRLLAKIAELNQLREEYIQTRKAKQKIRVKQLRQEFRALKKSIRQDWRLWCRVSRMILKLKPLEFA